MKNSEKANKYYQVQDNPLATRKSVPIATGDEGSNSRLRDAAAP